VLAALAALVDQSLLTRARSEDHDGRIEMQAAIREYALEQLSATGELEPARRRHAAYHADLAARLRFDVLGFHGSEVTEPLPRPDGSAEAVQVWFTEQLARLKSLTADHDNFQLALDWAAECDERAIELGLVGVLWSYWWYRGSTREGKQRLDAALRRAGDAPDPALMQALLVSLVPLLMVGDYDEALQHAIRAHDLAERIGDGFHALRLQGLRCGIEWAAGNVIRAVALLEETLRCARAAEDEWAEAQALNILGMILGTTGDLEGGIRLEQESLRLVRATGDVFAEPYVLTALAKLRLDQGDVDQADLNARDTATSDSYGPAIHGASRRRSSRWRASHCNIRMRRVPPGCSVRRMRCSTRWAAVWYFRPGGRTRIASPPMPGSRWVTQPSPTRGPRGGPCRSTVLPVWTPTRSSWTSRRPACCPTLT
jgi:tetratricopeptide (TPR) repeat protein